MTAVSRISVMRLVWGRIAGSDGRFRRGVSGLGYTLLLVWCVWWIGNLHSGRMLFAERTWIHLPAFGVDFLNHVDKPTRTWLANGDPYQAQQWFSYPPIVNRLFAWVSLADSQTSLRIWIGIAALFAAWGAAAAVRARDRLALEPLPMSLGIAAILFSTPVLFALERSNYDLLIVPCIAGAVALMRKEHTTGDVFAGLLLAVAAWAKVYPGLMIIGLIALRRWRAVGWMAIWGAFIGFMDLPGLKSFLRNIDTEIETAKNLGRMVHEIHPWNHPLGLVWGDLWAGTPLAYLPGSLGAAVVVGGLLAWVSWHVYTTPSRDRVSLPYLYWIVAAATFIPAVSNDYNLTPLPLAALALWSLRYNWAIQAGLLSLMLWWQPVALPLSGRTIMFVKIVGLLTVAAMLVSQMRRLMRSNHDAAVQA
jgi:hypothetical protein